MRSAQGVPSEQIINIDPSNKTRQVLLLQQRKALPSRQSGDDDDDNATAAAQESRIIADRTNIHSYNKDDDDDGVLPNSASDRRSPLTTSGAGDRPAGARAMQAAAAAATTMPKRYRRDPSPSSSSLSGDSRNSDSADPAPLAENQSGGRANRRAPPVAAAYGWRRSKSEVSASTCSLASLISPGIANKADCARAGQRSCCCGCWWCSCSRGDAADSNQFSSKCRGLSSSAESLSSARCLLHNHNRNHKQNHNTDSDCDANNHRLPKCHSRRRCHKHSSAEHRLQQVALLRKRGDSHADDHKQQQQLPPLQQQQEQPTTTSTDTASSALMRPNNCCTLALRCSSSSSGSGSGSRSDSQSCCPIKASCAADESYRRCIGSAGRRCLDHHYYDTKAFSSTPSFIGADCSKNALEHTRHQEEDHDDDLEGEKEEQVIIMINGGKLKESSDRKQQQQQVGDISSCGKKYYCGSDSLGADCSLVASSSIGDKTCACLLADKAAAAITSRVATIGQLDKTSTAATCCSPDVSPEQSSFELSSSSSTSSSSSDGSQTQLIRGLSARTTEAILTTAGGRYLQREQQATGAGEHRPAPSSGALAVAIDDAPTVSQQLSAAKKATDNKVSSSLAKSVMDIFSNQTLEDRLRITPLHKGGYPNNTLLVDLSKCHRNITSLWPSQPPASGRESFSLTNWWPSFLRRPGDGDDECQVNTNSCGSKRRPKKIRRTKLQFHMPDPLLRTDSSLKLEDYDKALCVLTSDVRYHLHLMLYRRIQAAWLLLSTMLCVLLPTLLTNLEYLIIVGALTCWLGLQLIGAFVTIQFRSKLNQMLEKSVAQVNSFFMDHNLMLGVINVGCLFSKSKLIIPVLYFDTSQCREQIESIISIDSRKDADGNVDSSKHILDYSRIGLPLTKPNAMALAQSQLAKKIILRYSQRWISYFDKRKLMFTDDRIRPRHLSTGKCLCQFIEEHFGNNGHDNNICEQQPPPSTKLQNHTQPTSASPPPLQTIHTYARTIANPLTINGKPSEQKQQPPQQEIQVRRKVIGKDAAALPTLSKQVSLRDETVAPCRDHLKIDMTDSVDAQAHSQTTGDSHNTKSNGFVLNSWHYLLGTQNEQQVQAVNNSSNLSPVSQQTRTSTTSSPDLSLEMGHDSICRSDVLIRKLRLLLEVRKNDLQGIDGTSLFSDALNKTQLLQPPLSIPNDPICSPPTTMDKDGSLSSGKSQANDDSSESNKVNEGKRFYIQKDGLFFFGGGKKNQQQQDRRQSNESRPNALEIC